MPLALLAIDDYLVAIAIPQIHILYVLAFITKSGIRFCFCASSVLAVAVETITIENPQTLS